MDQIELSGANQQGLLGRIKNVPALGILTGGKARAGGNRRAGHRLIGGKREVQIDAIRNRARGRFTQDVAIVKVHIAARHRVDRRLRGGEQPREGDVQADLRLVVRFFEGRLEIGAREGLEVDVAFAEGGKDRRQMRQRMVDLFDARMAAID